MEEIREEREKKGSLPPGETAMFCAQMALILKAGIPLYDGMETLCESIEDQKAKQVFRIISDTVNETGSLYQAVKEIGIFPFHMVHMIYIGEEIGKLEEVLESLSSYYEREESIRKAIQNAVIYPMVLILMMSVVIAVLVGKVMPVFEQVFKNLGSDMSTTGRTVMSAGVTAGKVTLAVTACLLLLMVVLYLVSKAEGGKEWIRRMSAKIPGIRQLHIKMAAGRFSAVLSMTLASGFGLEKALELAADIVSDPLTKEKIESCVTHVRTGMAFPEALAEIQIFPPLHARMIRVGYKAGKLDAVMKRLSALYQEDVDESIGRLVSFIEPALVALLSIIIGGILISVMLPLASLMSSIG